MTTLPAIGRPDINDTSKEIMKKLRLLKTSHEAGFTLIEILVVILVIGILAAIAIPVFLNQRQKANDSAVVSDLKQAGMLIEGSGKFTGALPADFKASKGVSVTAMRTSERNNQISSSQFIDGNSSRWGTFVSPNTPATVSEQLFTNVSDGYKGMNYRRINVQSGSNATVGQNVNITLTEPGKAGDKYTVGVAMRHNYTGCRTIHLEFKNAAGQWPGGIASQQVCFTQNQWQYFESTGTMNGDGAEYVYLSMFGSMSTGNNFDATGAAMVKGSTINSEAALDTKGNDFCLLGRHENNAGKLWRYSSLDGGVAEGGW